MINLFHIFFVSLFFIVLSRFVKNKSIVKLAVITGLVAGCIHLYLYLTETHLHTIYINVFHVLFVALFIICIGYNVDNFYLKWLCYILALGISAFHLNVIYLTIR
jgi:hypothetical protein